MRTQYETAVLLKIIIPYLFQHKSEIYIINRYYSLIIININTKLSKICPQFQAQ